MKLQQQLPIALQLQGARLEPGERQRWRFRFRGERATIANTQQSIREECRWT